MSDGHPVCRVQTLPVGPGATHHAGAVLLCRPRWRVPWFAPVRIGLLLFLAAVTKVLGDLGLGSAGLHSTLRAVTRLASLAAVYLLVHPVVIRLLFLRSNTGIAVEVRWAGRHRSGQPWLGLRAADGRVWRVLPRPGPASYPVPRWSGTPWLEPPPLQTGAIRGTLVHPHGTWRRGLVLHAPGDADLATETAADVLPLGADPHACLGIHLQSTRRVTTSSGRNAPRTSQSGGDSAMPSEPAAKESIGA